MLGTLFYRQNKGVRKVMNEVAIFENKSFGNVRVVDKNGEPWFVGKDVATALGYTSTNMTMVFQAVPEEWKGMQRMNTLSEG